MISSNSIVEMAELEDAPDRGSGERKLMGVQVSLSTHLDLLIYTMVDSC